uniref:Gamma-secretase subunit PEN-2 n=1 Tax=Magallana gigas TaxID=29159 RepID=A0A8W8LBL7_MAGGI
MFNFGKLSTSITMDLAKVKDEDKLNLCRKYYIGGFAFLPFLWFVNSVWFFREAFLKPEYQQQKQIKTYVIRSMIGTAIWIAIITTWEYHNTKKQSVEIGEVIS